MLEFPSALSLVWSLHSIHNIYLDNLVSVSYFNLHYILANSQSIYLNFYSMTHVNPSLELLRNIRNSTLLKTKLTVVPFKPVISQWLLVQCITL